MRQDTIYWQTTPVLACVHLANTINYSHYVGATHAWTTVPPVMMALLVILARMDLIIIWSSNNVIGNVKINKELIGIIVLNYVKIVLQIACNVNMISLFVLNAHHNIPYYLTLLVLIRFVMALHIGIQQIVDVSYAQFHFHPATYVKTLQFAYNVPQDIRLISTELAFNINNVIQANTIILPPRLV